MQQCDVREKCAVIAQDVLGCAMLRQKVNAGWRGGEAAALQASCPELLPHTSFPHTHLVHRAWEETRGLVVAGLG